MTGNAVGTSEQPITLNARQGTLRNLASINGSGGLTKTSAGTVIVRGANTYAGPTIIQAGTLALGESNALPSNAITLATAKLDAATFTDTVGTLEVTGSANIHLGTGAALTFSNSSTIPWTGTLMISGTFVSGSSIRFGNTDSGLTAEQLSRIIKPGGGSVLLDSSGFLVDAPVSAYSAWASTHAPTSTHGEDEDNDGVCNAVEYVLGGSVLRNDIALLPTMSQSGGNILFSFKRIQTSINPSTSVSIQVGTALHSWPTDYVVGEDTASSSTGVTVQKGQPTGFDTVTLSIPRSPDRQKFLRLNVTIAP
jgi:autotransporter-associated beta strand protein